jgi:hypothetical protein
MHIDLTDVFASPGSVFKMVLMNQSEVFSSRKISDSDFQTVFYSELASQGHLKTLENTARGRKKVHEVQTHQVKSNSKPPEIAQTDPQEKFP